MKKGFKLMGNISWYLRELSQARVKILENLWLEKNQYFVNEICCLNFLLMALSNLGLLDVYSRELEAGIGIKEDM